VAGQGALDDPVICRGVLQAPEDGAIHLRSGLAVEGGQVDLGDGVLTVEDATSGVTGGMLLAGSAYVGRTSAGRFRQVSSTCAFGGDLVVGDADGVEGTYELNGGTLTVAGWEYIGRNGGTGRFVHLRGDHVTGYFYLPGDGGLGGSYEMQQGTVKANELSIGRSGRFVQAGGLVDVTNLLSVNGQPDAEAVYELRNGRIGCMGLYVAQSGQGRFIQTGGEVLARTWALNVAYGNGTRGTYELRAGQITAPDVFVGYYGDGTFVQTGGVVTAAQAVQLGYYRGRGTYELRDGQVNTSSAQVGLATEGVFLQGGGRLDVDGVLFLGYEHNGIGTYTISDGALRAAELKVGRETTYGPSTGTFEIAGPDADVRISDAIRLGRNSRVLAVPGATIHLAGLTFENRSTDPAALAGLENLTLACVGSSTAFALLEIAGEDRAIGPGCMERNFALGTLDVTSRSQVRLVDLFDNQPGWDGGEALYVRQLILGPGANLDLNGLNLYYLDFVDQGGQVLLNGGALMQVPEPATLSLLALAGAALLRRRRRRRPA
jgi:hypothetical protein